NTYGPRQSARAVIPTIITQIAAGARKIKLGSIHPTRDFNFVADTGGGFLAALDSRAGIGEVINIGSGFEISIGDTANLIAELMGVEIEIEHDDVRVRPGAARSSGYGPPTPRRRICWAGRRVSAASTAFARVLNRPSPGSPSRTISPAIA
ncbi:NAD-dependent epimerase/dehydratase family protein, partial [Acinetobacter baumannii]|uniref:NAD-dependent epimerase/dehydratase family protein n=1 Tax=Acinetobacter baumannii TaxID=470 RepID=UPI001BB4644C